MDIEALIEFVREHRDEDTVALLLKQERYRGVDMGMVAQQIEGWRRAAVKWPSLAHCETFLYPPRLNREQSSSEDTARYKREVVAPRLRRGAAVADLTGGMGIDSMALAALEGCTVDYVERDAELCRLMAHNVGQLGLKNVRVCCGDGLEWLARQEQPQFDLLYIDPARRDSRGRKVAAFEDCTPDIGQHLDLLKRKARLLMVKASPMMDIDSGAAVLGPGTEVHVVAVGGECKELLFLWDAERGEAPLTIHCIDIVEGEVRDYVFCREEERQCDGRYATQVGRYLYEPDAALMKGGPFKLIGMRQDVEQLGRNTHLYTSDTLREWPRGRRWEVVCPLQLSRKAVAAVLPGGRAHVVTRNYPERAEELQRRLGLKEGGDLFVVATTVGRQRCAMLCKSV